MMMMTRTFDMTQPIFTNNFTSHQYELNFLETSYPIYVATYFVKLKTYHLASAVGNCAESVVH